MAPRRRSASQAGEVVIDDKPGSRTITIDGEAFPYQTRGDITVNAPVWADEENDSVVVLLPVVAGSVRWVGQPEE